MEKIDLLKILKPHNQEHLLEYWDELTNIQKEKFKSELANVNWSEIDDLVKDYVLRKPQSEIPGNLLPPDYYPLIPENNRQKELYHKAVEKAQLLLKEGKVAAFTVAGGQGSRLGFDGPKGTFPITPVKNKSLFQYFAEVIGSNIKRYGKTIPWYIMTSSLNHEQTRDFFNKHDYFGLDPDDIIFFVQGTMPAIDYNGKLVLAGKASLALAPNGHGGSLLALKKSGALDDMKKRGIDYISYFQVDNPLVTIINPLFIGLHCLEDSEMSAIILKKTGPFEKLGNFCRTKNKLMIIEYSDMPDELAKKKDSDGKLCFIAGSPAIHVISRTFVERLTSAGRLSLPWHRADKKVPFIKNGEVVTPSEPNAVKLETFIFDALPLAKKTMLLEAKREDEFAPTKNKTGVDSVESCREMLVDRDARWLEEGAGIKILRDKKGKIDCVVELSRVSYLDKNDICKDSKKIMKKMPERGERVYYE